MTNRRNFIKGGAVIPFVGALSKLDHTEREIEELEEDDFVPDKPRVGGMPVQTMYGLKLVSYPVSRSHPLGTVLYMSSTGVLEPLVHEKNAKDFVGISYSHTPTSFSTFDDTWSGRFMWRGTTAVRAAVIVAGSVIQDQCMGWISDTVKDANPNIHWL